jgi:hypothetical protein
MLGDLLGTVFIAAKLVIHFLAANVYRKSIDCHQGRYITWH